MVEKEGLLKIYYHYLHYHHYISGTRKSQNYTETLKCNHNLGDQVELRGEVGYFAPGLDSINKT